MLRLARRGHCIPIAVVVLTLAPSAAAAPGDITTVAGTGIAGRLGDAGAATLAQLNASTAVAPLSDGSLLIADFKNNRIRKVSSTGAISTVAGNGTAGAAGDGGPATAAQLAAPVGVAPLPAGGFLIADSASNRIRMVSSSGVITTVAGTGAAGSRGDGGAATRAQLNGPTDAEPTADGGFLVADYKNDLIRKVSSTGMITTVAGTGSAGFGGDGGAATAARLKSALSVAPLADGGFLVADSGNSRIRKVSSAGVITTVAGTGVAAFSGDGGMATAAALNVPTDAQPTADGGFLVADMFNNRVRAVAANGTITTVAGTGAAAFGGDGAAATAARLNAPVGVAVTPGGATLIADSGNNRIRSIEPAPAPIATTAPAPNVAAPPTSTPLERLAEVRLILPSRSVTATASGRVPLRISCSAHVGAACRGTVTLEVAVHSTRASTARVRVKKLKIARAKFSVAPGRKATIRVRLSRRGRQLLAKKSSLKVTAKIARRGGQNLGQKTETSVLTIKKRGTKTGRRGARATAVVVRSR
jgi:hypothetical protein